MAPHAITLQTNAPHPIHALAKKGMENPVTEECHSITLLIGKINRYITIGNESKNIQNDIPI
jgi:hypothetical protein